MNKKLQVILCLLLALAGIAGMVGCAFMLVMAVITHEWGRVVFYGFIALVCVELTGIMIARLIKLFKK